MRTRKDWKVVRWDFVKGIANNEFSRVVVLIPIAGYLILFNDEIARIASFNALAGVGEGDSSPFMLDGLTKLRMVFLGSLSVLCSSLIYRVFRPEVLQSSNGELEFSELVAERYSVYEIAQMEQHVGAENWTARTEAFGIWRSKRPLVSGFRPNARANMFSAHSDYISFLAREWWAGQMHTHRLARVSSAVLGVLGYLLLALPTIDIAQTVLRHLFVG